MDRKLFEILTGWLKDAGYRIDQNRFELSLLSHPDYGRLTSITDTFADFSIEHVAATVPFEALPGLTEPFLAFIRNGHQEQFALITPLQNEKLGLTLGLNNTLTLAVNEFFPLWTGTVVAIDRKEEPEKEPPAVSTYLLVALPVLLLLLLLLSQPALYQFLHFFLALIGLLICSLIVNHQLGFNNGFTAKFCSLTKNTDCESVLNSDAAKLTNNIGLSDIGIVFFTMQVLIHLFPAALTHGGIILQYIISIAAVPFIFYSLYQQKVIIKKWCPFCLGVLCVLFLQGVAAAFALPKTVLFHINLYSILPLLLVAGAVTISWYFLLPALKAKKSLKALSIESLSFRRNHHLLIPYLQNQPVFSGSPNCRTIEIGNPLGKFKILAVTNPLCHSCIELHTAISKMTGAHSELSVNLIFYVPLNSNDPRTIIAGHFLSQNAITAPVIIEEWYKKPNAKQFIKHHGIQSAPSSLEILEKHKNWCYNNHIFTTPAIFLNGKRFPSFYRPADIQFFIAELMSSPWYTTTGEISTPVLVDNT